MNKTTNRRINLRDLKKPVIKCSINKKNKEK
jgi:hypothetical protein